MDRSCWKLYSCSLYQGWSWWCEISHEASLVTDFERVFNVNKRWRRCFLRWRDETDYIWYCMYGSTLHIKICKRTHEGRLFLMDLLTNSRAQHTPKLPRTSKVYSSQLHRDDAFAIHIVGAHGCITQVPLPKNCRNGSHFRPLGLNCSRQYFEWNEGDVVPANEKHRSF